MENVQREITLKEAKGNIFFHYFNAEIDYTWLKGPVYRRGREKYVEEIMHYHSVVLMLKRRKKQGLCSIHGSSVVLSQCFDPNDLRFN